MTLHKFGNNTQSVSTYFPWSESGGRLHMLQSGPIPAVPNPFNPSLQNLTYNYDTVGNITSISAISATLTTETQTFTYDASTA